MKLLLKISNYGAASYVSARFSCLLLLLLLLPALHFIPSSSLASRTTDALSWRRSRGNNQQVKPSGAKGLPH